MGQTASNKGVLECCCGCVGSCFPYTCSGSVCTLTDIPWIIDAPNCPAIDGAFGVFSPFTLASSFRKGKCGPCVCYESVAIITLPGKQRSETGGGSESLGFGDPIDPEGPPAICTTFDCTIPLRFYLGFDASIEGCCTASLVVEMLNTGLALNSGIPQKPNTIACIPQAVPVDNTRFRQFDFDSCTCLPPLGTGAGFSAIFDLSRITWTCKAGNHPADSPCYPFSKCCELFGCSLAGATLSI